MQGGFFMKIESYDIGMISNYTKIVNYKNQKV